jgi:hypothetical protein
MNRRALLYAAGAASVGLCGCLGVGGREGEGTEVEIIPSNSLDERIRLDVTVGAKDGTVLLDHSYSLAPGHASESQGVENRVGYVEVSLNGGNVVRHEYDPTFSSSGFECHRDGEDVQINVTPNGINFTYSC